MNSAYMHLNSRENWDVKNIFALAKWHTYCSILSRIYPKYAFLPLKTCHPSVTLVTL